MAAIKTWTTRGERVALAKAGWQRQGVIGEASRLAYKHWKTKRTSRKCTARVCRVARDADAFLGEYENAKRVARARPP